jgi:hypothetical protein
MSGRWIVDQASILSYHDDQAVPDMAADDDKLNIRVAEVIYRHVPSNLAKSIHDWIY